MHMSKNFSSAETACRCGCGQNYHIACLYEVLELLRSDYFNNLPMITHCVNRCPEHNKKIGGVQDSYHILGRAWDGHVRGISIPELHKLAYKAHDDQIIKGLGLYSWGIHVDTGRRRVWTG
jgi:uncharacterized protein YcbK (DUF882 family)